METQVTAQTTRQYFDANVLNMHKDMLFERLDDFFGQGGVSMPLGLLHSQACDLAEHLEDRAKEVEESEEQVGAFTLKNAADSIFRITFTMWKIAEIYEAYEHCKSYKEKHDPQD